MGVWQGHTSVGALTGAHERGCLAGAHKRGWLGSGRMGVGRMGEGRRLEREGVVLGLGRMGIKRQSSRAHEMPRGERALLRGEIRDGRGWDLRQGGC